MDILFYLVFAALTACAQAITVNRTIADASGIKVRLLSRNDSGINLILERNGKSEEIVIVGPNVGAAISVTSDTATIVHFENDVNLTVISYEVRARRGRVVSLAWLAPKTVKLMDCVNYGTYNWYGGPQQKRQLWPIEKLSLNEYSYVTKEADNCAVAERYWLSSGGLFYYIEKKVPLFVDSNNIRNGSACFIASVEAPYSSNRTRNTLEYDIAIFADVRQAHQYAVQDYLNKPTGYPDELMIKNPIWSTWARYKTAVNDAVVLKFADEITENGFPNSQFELDDLWEVCYGSLTVDKTRFPSLKNTTAILRSKGFRTTMWVHPFLNKNCEPWYTNATSSGYVVSSESGNVETRWWNNNGTTTAYIDFTKDIVRKWYIGRLMDLKTETGVDAYKFDGGESSWSPQIPVLQGNIEEQPNSITSDYVRAVSQFGNLVEVRVGFGTQELPVFVRMIDKDSYWTFENGLPTLITTMFQMNVNGYPLVLPDMIGGNGYNNTAPTKELFIRWLQANTFMPSMQFSFVPWDYNDDETITISKKFVNLHAEYAPTIIEACKKAVSDGAPVNMPIWWISPNDTVAHGIWDEYLLGETILVAPVVTQGAVTRDIYLPAGTWYDQGNKSKIIEGPIWLRNYSAPIDVLPYFVLKPNAATAPVISVVLVVFAVIVNVFN